MKLFKSCFLILALLSPVFNAQAHGYGGWRGGGYYGGRGWYGGSGWGYRGGGFYGGIVIGPGLGYGGGWGWGWPYYPPYYAYPPAVVTVPVPTSPPVYIEQGVQPAPQDPANYWHYCSNPPGYYPTVQECPGGWQLVPPQPPAPQ